MSVQSTYHPLDPLTPAELQQCVKIVRQATGIVASPPTTARLHFKGIQLLEPSKAVLAPYLDEWHAAVAGGDKPRRLPRQANVLVGHKSKSTAEWYGEIL